MPERELTPLEELARKYHKYRLIRTGASAGCFRAHDSMSILMFVKDVIEAFRLLGDPKVLKSKFSPIMLCYTCIQTYCICILDALEVFDQCDDGCILSSTTVFNVMHFCRCGFKGYKKRWNSLSLKCHPDKGGDPEEFKRIVMLYELVKDFFCTHATRMYVSNTKSLLHAYFMKHIDFSASKVFVVLMADNWVGDRKFIRLNGDLADKYYDETISLKSEYASSQADLAKLQQELDDIRSKTKRVNNDVVSISKDVKGAMDALHTAQNKLMSERKYTKVKLQQAEKLLIDERAHTKHTKDQLQQAEKLLIDERAHTKHTKDQLHNAQNKLIRERTDREALCKQLKKVNERLHKESYQLKEVEKLLIDEKTVSKHIKDQLQQAEKNLYFEKNETKHVKYELKETQKNQEKIMVQLQQTKEDLDAKRIDTKDAECELLNMKNLLKTVRDDIKNVNISLQVSQHKNEAISADLIYTNAELSDTKILLQKEHQYVLRHSASLKSVEAELKESITEKDVIMKVRVELEAKLASSSKDLLASVKDNVSYKASLDKAQEELATLSMSLEESQHVCSFLFIVVYLCTNQSIYLYNRPKNILKRPARSSEDKLGLYHLVKRIVSNCLASSTIKIRRY
jgi:hypothetical protein